VLAWAIVILMPTRRAACRLTAGTLQVLFALAGCRIRVRGREFLDGTRAKVLVANHASYCDVLVLMAGLGANYRFVAKSEVRSIPFIRTFLRKMGHYAFDRSNPKARVRQAEEIEQTLLRGESVFLFPEGTFTPYQGVQAFQLGAFKAAVAAGCPVCPIALRGTREILRDETYLPCPGSVTITVCPPIEPSRVGPGAMESEQHQKSSGSSGETSSDWHEIVRLRDAAREAIGRECGEPML
jgi:1-acyl-sn-glycerol-3-phosphate acyltransferase